MGWRHGGWEEPNLACHPVWAVLSKAQWRRDSAHNFVHLLIVDPTTGKNTMSLVVHRGGGVEEE